LKKKRINAFLCLSALTGTFLGITFSFNIYYFFLASLASLLLLFLCRTKPLQALYFLLFTCLIFASAARFSRNAYDQSIQTIATNNTTYNGIVTDIQKSLDGDKKLFVKSQNLNLIIILHDSAAAYKITIHDAITFKTTIQPLYKPLSPVYFNSYNYGLAHTIHGRGHIYNSHDIFINSHATQKLDLASLREHIRTTILQNCTPHQGALLLALILGETSLFADSQREIYASIGAQHLLAVSGLQVTLIAALVFLLFLPLIAFFLPAHKTHYAYLCAAFITIVLVWLFVDLCGWPKSALRAGIMSTIMLLPLVFSRTPDTWDALCGSALICLLFDPLSSLDLGFLLSYSAVFGILLVHDLSKITRDKISSYSNLGSSIFALVLSSMAAFLFTLPIISYAFGVFSPYSFIANCVLIPVASILQIIALLFCFIGVFFNITIFITFSAWSASFIEILADFLQDFLGHLFYWPFHNQYITLILSSIIIFLFISIIISNKKLIISNLIVLLITNFILSRAPRDFLVRVLPVGQGDASLFSFPSGEHVLVDAGGQLFGHFDPGLSVIVPTLKRLGIKQLDALIITHPDPDHILGAFAVIDHIKIKEIWHSGYSAEHPLTRRLLSSALQKNISIKNAKDLPETIYFGSSQIKIVYPYNKNLGYDPNLSSNNNSLVLKITHQNITFLWPGDIEAKGEELLLSHNNNLQATVLKAPHHGSKTSSTLGFINSVKPEIVIYSTGIANKFNFPHHEIIKRYEALGTKSYDTAHDGEITLGIRNNKLSISTFRAGL
jgi:competence protein ComEC